MNRKTFLQRLVGAFTALLLPWKVEAAEPTEPVCGSGHPMDPEGRCPRCGGLRVIPDPGWSAVPKGYTATAGYLPDYVCGDPPAVPCPRCRPFTATEALRRFRRLMEMDP